MLTIMGGIAEFERGLIRKRTDEGIERARKQGKKFGRPERRPLWPRGDNSRAC